MSPARSGEPILVCAAWEPPLPSRFRSNSGRRVVAFGAEVGWLMADPPTSAPG